ncbi:unnamed protein product, partial [Musa textilis]
KENTANNCATTLGKEYTQALPQHNTSQIKVRQKIIKKKIEATPLHLQGTSPYFDYKVYLLHIYSNGE